MLPYLSSYIIKIKMKYKKILILFLLVSQVFAKEMIYLSRSPRALFMGDAHTALAGNDEFSLYYNPASLGGNNGLSFTPLNPGFGITNVLGELERFQNFPSSDAAAIAERITGLPIYLNFGVWPGFKMAFFGFSLIAQNRTSIILRNRTHPSLDIDYRYDKGFVTGFAVNLQNSKSSRHSLGYGLKYITRDGLQNSFDLFSTDILNIINSGVGDVAEIREAIGFSKGKGFGHDIGYEFMTTSGRNTFSFGASILDVGDLKFKESIGAAGVPDQEMMINSGVAFKQDFTLFDYTLAMDIHPINQPIPFGRKFHFGMELGLPFISVLGGWGDGYFNYGLDIRLWPIQLIMGFYSVELGNSYREEEGKRAMILLKFFDMNFDAY